jgi:hypothetical protein
MSNNNRSSSHIAVDLCQRNSLRALAILCSTKGRKGKVKSAFVHVQDGSEWQAMEDTLQTMVAAFAMLGSLPNLRSLTMDLQHRTLPVESLLMLLEGARGLKELELRRVSIPGERTPESLHKVLLAHTSLQSLTFSHCQACEVVQAFISQLPLLLDLKIIDTKISGQETVSSMVLNGVCRRDQLRRLHLEDVPDLHDEHIRSLASTLATTRNLHQLHLSSISLGERAGRAVAKMLMTNNSINKVTLELGYWSKCGSAMAQVLQTNTSVTQLKVLLTGSHQASVENKARELLAALSGNYSNVTDVTLCILDTSTNPSRIDGPLLDSFVNVHQVWKALDDVLETNHTLEKVVIMDACLQTIDTPASTQASLDRNRAGLSRLLYGTDQDQDHEDNFHEKYISAIIDHKNNLDLVYFAICNYPSILSFCDSVDANSSPMGQESVTGDDQAIPTRKRDPPSPTSSFLFPSYTSKSRSTSTPTRFLQQGVRRLRGRWNQQRGSKASVISTSIRVL